MRFFAIFCLLILSAAPFALVQWSASASQAVSGKPILASGKAIYASYDGKLRAVNLDSGSSAWFYDALAPIALEPQLADDSTVAIVSEGGKIHLVSVSNGKVIATANAGRQASSFAAGGGRVFVALNDSVFAYSLAGKPLWNITLGFLPGQVGFSSNTVYFTAGGKMYSVNPASGTVKWASPSSDSYLSRPVEYEGLVYFGGTDGRLYALDYVSGRVRWSYKTGGWVMSTPTASSKAVYFGSADGSLYKVTTSGEFKWKFKTNGGIYASPVLYQAGSQLVAVFGSEDGKVYAVDTATGEEAWSFSAYGKPTAAAEENGAFIFGTSRGKVYSLSPSPICSFTYPPANDAVGNWTVDVEGKASSDSGIARVDVRVSGGQWIAAEGDEIWHATVDLSQLEDGAIDVECRASDNSGRSEISEFSYVTLVKSGNAPLRRMYAIAPYLVEPNETFNISVQDERGHNIYGLRMKIGGGEAKTVDSPLRLTLGRSGAETVSFEKSGFEPVGIKITGKGGIDFALIAVVLVVLLIAAAAYFLFGKKLLAALPLGKK